MVGSRVVARTMDREPGRDGKWFVREQEGVVKRDYMLAFSEEGKVQNLYRVEFSDGKSGNFWSKQLEVIE